MSDQRISWDQYFIAQAAILSTRSTCTRLHVGAVLVKNNRIIASGYNGAIAGTPHCTDVGDLIVDGHCIRAVHAEQNAILNARGKNLEGCSIYVNLFPCHDCARNIIQSGIKKVYYLEDKYKETDSTKASKFMFEKAKVECIRLKPRAEKIEISFKTQD